MSDEELAELSPGALVALIHRLEEQLAAITAQLAAAQARIQELEAERTRRGGPPKTPQNSSTPPSKGWRRERPPATEGAKRGPPFGHPGTSRRRAAPDWLVLCQPTHCAACGHDLPAGRQERVGVSQVVELPRCSRSSSKRGATRPPVPTAGRRPPPIPRASSPRLGTGTP